MICSSFSFLSIIVCESRRSESRRHVDVDGC
ncbi:uncharacterized protein CELE_R12B2.13 [Caenorhabditis elegans]|uniref:Uncharacterized protein n=1 Tax=Caenorhabditis elegans TaxID=6239 RepID=A0A2K5ATW9_CAEEL|nr:Uncharacterized protein CELE_R12B2.13 [Caenorhabditis elegans]SPC47546.2 Uncharacterized protein CELE_R12B2.13 [Caenorhabditis elegans]|eukprot:NP_001348751.2 Uncharacterized protein CELE_R12B2.13 [Caenorhabditis elegans]